MRYLEFKPHSPAKIRIYLCPGLGFRGAGQIARQIASGKTLIRIPRYTMTFLVLVFIESIIRTRICDGLVCEFKINDRSASMSRFSRNSSISAEFDSTLNSI